MKILDIRKSIRSSKYTSLFFNYILYYSSYARTRRLLKGNFPASKADIERYQFAKLKEIITYSYRNVPYYRELFDKIDFHPDDFQTIHDLAKVPYLTKNLVRENLEKLVSQSISSNDIKVAETGGTTGLPMIFYLNKRTTSLIEMAYLEHMWKRIGYKPYHKCILLREDTVEKIFAGKIYWKMNYLTNWLTMSSFHLNADTFHVFYNKIISFKPKFIIAFPSNAYLLARFIKDNNLPGFPSLKGIICSSENMYDWQRKYMEEIFKVRIFSYYGHSEKCIIGSEFAESNFYEFYPQYGYMELINPMNKPCENEDERGEIVATGFNNFVSPFIRYKTEDIGIYTMTKSKENPHWVTLKRIEGRKQDFIIDMDKTPKSSIHLDRPFWNIRHIIFAYQYVQDTPGKLVLNIYASCKLTEDQIEDIKKHFYAVHFKFELTVNQVDHISRTKNGKFRYLVQNIKLNL